MLNYGYRRMDRLHLKEETPIMSQPMPDIVIRRGTPGENERIYAFQCDYLDREDEEAFRKRLAHVYLAAFRQRELAGIIYGEPSRRVPGAFAVQGVAVDLTPAKQCARRGIGSALLRAFGREAASLGYRLLDVGAADDERVERFYLKNGFLPYELVAKGTDGLERARAPIADYREGKRLQHELRNRHEAEEVIFIFRKPLPFA